MEWVPALVCALIGAALGLLVPWLVARCPEPEHDPDENPEDYPDHVPFARLAARPGLRWGSAVACGLAAGVLGLALGWGWALLWLLPLVPVCCALTVIDYVTWYLPSRLIQPAWLVTGVLVGVVAVIVGEPRVALWGLIGFVALGGYYGLMWLVSPRAMAGGDVRLGALLGIALGPFGAGVLIVSAVAAAVLAVLGLVPLRRNGTMIRRRVPYGPFLVLGALAAIVVGQVLSA
ncbi:prepilin peptidase [Nocardioides nitrophenolicus]|uniref:prepilin peptidase n=1 Tax=Nocardioides nitrophenolicus TaxID=60489 RepID=UPI001958ED6D|nr:prepilin peptidase [Nocardioides nitrophenolicus]MBM7520200.1 leader peptidase (prepilin peptidase)/N-methyltransferase [Nocardioides nitrophenolicus]